MSSMSVFGQDAYPRDLQFLFAMTSSLMAPGAAERMASREGSPSGADAVAGVTAAAAASPAELLQRLDRPYSCPVPECGGRFHRKFTLHEHMKTHTGEKPHACPIASCGKRFSTSGNLARHKRLHATSKLKCPVTACTRVFTKKEKLIRHLKVHMGSTTHTCAVAECSKTFSTAGNLTRHMKTQHPTVSIVKAPSKARSELLLPDRIFYSVKADADDDMESAPSAFGADDGTSTSGSAPSSPLRELVAGVSPAQSPVPADKALDFEILELLDCLFVPEAGSSSSGSECAGVAVAEPLHGVQYL